MCGICGEIRLDGSTPSLYAVSSMMEVLQPRGPDGSGVVSHANAALGHRRLDMNVLMSLAVLGALLLGDWAEAAAAAALFAVGNVAQNLTFDRTRNALASLSRLTPPEALRLIDGREELVPVEALMTGDVVRVRPGQRFPIDGAVLEGATTADESLITGESLPAEKSPGSSVYGGALNGAGSVTVEVSRSVAESTISQIVQLVEEARGGRGRSEQLIDRFAAIYTPIVVIGAVLLALVGGAVTGDWRSWIERGLVLLVVACPCALIISTPVALVSAVGVAARRGFLVKGGAALEALATLRSVVFDKTGTLTQGRPSVVGVTAVEGNEAELVRLAAAVESLSEHPLGHAVLQDAAARSLTVPAATDFISATGMGASAMVEGRRIWIGAPRWFDQLSVSYRPNDLQLAADGRTVLLVAEERGRAPAYLGAIAVADLLRADSPAVVAQLKRLGLAPVAMMTGDNQATAEAIARQTGIDTVYAQLMPADKVRLITDLREQLGAVGMVGDGVNDGPALGGATVGFAMGLTGSDLAVETSDVTILRNDLYSVPGAIDLSRRTVSIIKQNIAFSLVVKVLALALTVLGITNLWMAVALDLGTSLIVTSNALRLTRWQMPGATRASRTAHHAPAGDAEATGEATGLATGDA